MRSTQKISLRAESPKNIILNFDCIVNVSTMSHIVVMMKNRWKNNPFLQL